MKNAVAKKIINGSFWKVDAGFWSKKIVTPTVLYTNSCSALY